MCHERTPEAPFRVCGGFSWINSGTLPTERGLREQCHGGRRGVPRSSNTQVCVFLLRLSAFHTSAALLHKGRKPPDMLVAGKLKRRSWEAAAEELCAKCPPSPNRAWADHLDSSGFCPC